MDIVAAAANGRVGHACRQPETISDDDHAPDPLDYPWQALSAGDRDEREAWLRSSHADKGFAKTALPEANPGELVDTWTLLMELHMQSMLAQNHK